MMKRLTKIAERLATGINRFICIIVGHAWFIHRNHVRCGRCGEFYKKVEV